jgi:hypothetical protein
MEDVTDSSRRREHPFIAGIGLQRPIPWPIDDFETWIGDAIPPMVEGTVSDVSAVMVSVGVKTGVGVTVAEITTVMITPGVEVTSTVMVIVSGVGVGSGVGVKVGIGS